MVELMFLAVIGPCHDTITYLNQLIQYYIRVHLKPYLFLCNTDLKYIVFE